MPSLVSVDALSYVMAMDEGHVRVIVEPILDDEMNYPEWDDELGSPLQLDEVIVGEGSVKLSLLANGWDADSAELLAVCEKAKAALIAQAPDLVVTYQID